MCDDLTEIGTMLLEPAKVGRKFVVAEIFAACHAALRRNDVGRNLQRDAFAMSDANQRAALSQGPMPFLARGLFAARIYRHVGRINPVRFQSGANGALGNVDGETAQLLGELQAEGTMSVTKTFTCRPKMILA